MFEYNNLRINIVSALAVIATVGGCATAPVAELNPQTFDDSSAVNTYPSTYIGERLAALDYSRISKIEMANLALDMESVGEGEDNYLAEEIVLLASSAEIDVHEISQPTEKDSLEHKARNFITHSFDARAYTSVSQEVPAGWRRVDNGILHENSGMVCLNEIDLSDANFSIQLQQVRVFDEVGLDVACDFKGTTGGWITTFSSYWPDTSLQDHANAAAAQIREQFNTTTALPVPYLSLEGFDGEVLAEPVVIGYDISQADSPDKIKSSLWLVKEQGWHVKVRATHALDDQLTEILAAIMFIQTQVNIFEKSKAAQIGDVEV